MTRRLLGLSAILLFAAAAWSEAPTALAPAPKGFDARRDGVERGKVETIEYDSKSMDSKRKMVIYTPPGYSKETSIRSSTCCTGPATTRTAGRGRESAAAILDNLYADRKIAPMIVVMPNGSRRGGFGPGTARGRRHHQTCRHR